MQPLIHDHPCTQALRIQTSPNRVGLMVEKSHPQNRIDYRGNPILKTYLDPYEEFDVFFFLDEP